MIVKCISTRVNYLTPGKFYSIKEESSLNSGVYFITCDDGSTTSISQGTEGMLFLDEFRDQIIKDLLT